MHKELYKFLRFPLGIKVAPVIFQQVDTMLSGQDFAIAYLDDILIKSKTQEEHTRHVKDFSKKIKEFRFKLSIEKCKLFYQKSSIWDKSETKKVGAPPHNHSDKTCSTLSIEQSLETGSTFSIHPTIGMPLNSGISLISNALPIITKE